MSSNQKLPILPKKPRKPVPEYNPLLDIASDAVFELLHSIKECVLKREIEKTKRTQLREQARIAITQIECDTSIYLSKIKSSHEERMEVIELCKTMLSSNFVSHQPILEVTEACIKLLESCNVGEL